MRAKRLFYVIVIFVCMAIFTLPFQVFAHSHHGEAPTPQEKPYVQTAEKNTLQKLIDATEPGGTLVLEGHTYRGAISITKPITIKGVEGTRIASLENAVTISNTENVIIEDIEIQAEKAAIIVSDINKLTIKNINIKQENVGIQISKSTSITLENVDITGEEGHFSTKGHAIAIYDSKNFQASESDIASVMDGFYIERVDNISLNNNRVLDGRYAVHMMYSDNVSIKQNEVRSNMTGFMIMVANKVSVTNNIVAKNNTLNSLGVYTYDVVNMSFSNNELSENTVAMDIQNTREMDVNNNVFSTNGTVIQAKRSGSLTVHENEFYGNILTVRTDKEGLILQHNIYDDYTGKDYDGDRIGDTKYIATNSFGQWMVRKPVYQYFIESPSVVTLNMMDTEVTDGNELVVVDEQPVVMKKSYNTVFSINVWQLLGSSIVLIAMFIVRRRLR